MHRHTFALALVALAIIMLAGCKQPIGLPINDVQAAAWQTFYCYPANLLKMVIQ